MAKSSSVSLEILNEKISEIIEKLANIGAALDHLSGRENQPSLTLTKAPAYHWEPGTATLVPVMEINRIPLSLLRGIDDVRDILLANTRQFARGHGANNALLWGARGMGKSSLVKAVHAQVASEEAKSAFPLTLIEINREDLPTLPRLLRGMGPLPGRFIAYCDDLSFDQNETSYKSLKTVLDGGLEGRPNNVIFYATSNRRHLMPREMIENERSTAISPHESVEEKISLSDRFGLWLGFHNCDQPTYLAMVSEYRTHYGLKISDDVLIARAIEWSATRGARSGRVAVQFVRHLAGELGMPA